MTEEKNREPKSAENEEVKLNDLKQRMDMIFDLKSADLMGEEYRKFEASIKAKVEQLQLRYPDWQNYKLYHLLIRSTFDGECPKFDFPGDDSIEKFVEESEGELENKGKKEKPA